MQQTATSDGHVNIWRTVVLRGVIFGASRTKDGITVTYSRPMCPKCGNPVIDHPHRLENGDTWHSKCVDDAQASTNNDKSLSPKTSDPNDVITQLERPVRLKEQGILTEEELQAQKKKILGM